MPIVGQRQPSKKRPRTSGEKVDRAIDLGLLGDDVDALIHRLNEHEQALFWEEIHRIRSGGKEAESEKRDLWKIDYEREPPTMQEFLEDDYWLGKLTRKSEESNGMFPKWKELLIRDWDLDSRVNNAVWTGSLGTGKTWVSMTVMAYRIVLARLLRNPSAFLGLSKGSMIFYVILSISKSVVEETAFGDLKNFMANCPFFTEVCRYDPDRQYSNLRIPIGKNIIVTGGSRGQHIIGRNAMGCAMDEGNFRLEANPDTKAYELYDEIRNRIKNRFSRISGFLPAVSILASSARDQSSFTERVIDEIKKNPNDNTQKIYSFAVYEIKPGLKLSNRYFKVAYGLRNVDPSVLQGAYDKDGKKISETVEEPPKGAQTKLVPEDYIDEFRRNIRTALQSITGVSTGSNFRLFGSSVDIERSIARGEQVGLTNPCRVESVSLSDEDKSTLWDYLDHKKILTLHHSEIIPLRDRTAPRCIHIDLAKTSQAGLAVSHIVGRQEVEGKYNVMTGETFAKYDYVVEFDFIFSIIAGKHKPISTRKILAFIYWLRDVAHYPIALVTADQYNSLFPLQLLESNGFKISQLSVDRSKKPYYDFRNGIEENRVRMFRHNILVNELENLIDTDKIDHPTNGTKDVADACCGSYFNSINMAGQLGVDPTSGLNPSFYTAMSQGGDEKAPVEINIDVPRRRIMQFEA
jgi:hypothetical protein